MSVLLRFKASDNSFDIFKLFYLGLILVFMLLNKIFTDLRFIIECADYIGLANGAIQFDLITASSSRSRLTLPDRARLGISASDRKCNTMYFILEI